MTASNLLRTVLVLCIGGCAGTTSSAGSGENPAGTDGAVQEELLRAEHEWVDAAVAGDTLRLAHILADEFAGTNPDGSPSTKRGDIESIASGAVDLESIDLSDLRARAYGSTGIVTGLADLRGTAQGRDISGNFRFTDVFVKRDGRWQAVASQGTAAATQ